MIVLGDGVCSDENLVVGHPYLARLAEGHYQVVRFFDPSDHFAKEIHYKKARFYDENTRASWPTNIIAEVAPIF